MGAVLANQAGEKSDDLTAEPSSEKEGIEIHTLGEAGAESDQNTEGNSNNCEEVEEALDLGEVAVVPGDQNVELIQVEATTENGQLLETLVITEDEGGTTEEPQVVAIVTEQDTELVAENGELDEPLVVKEDEETIEEPEAVAISSDQNTELIPDKDELEEPFELEEDQMEQEDQYVQLVSDDVEIDAAPAAEADEAVTVPEEVLVFETAIETSPENGENEEQLDIKDDEEAIEVLEAVEIVVDQDTEKGPEDDENEEALDVKDDEETTEIPETVEIVLDQNAEPINENGEPEEEAPSSSPVGQQVELIADHAETESASVAEADETAEVFDQIRETAAENGELLEIVAIEGDEETTEGPEVVAIVTQQNTELIPENRELEEPLELEEEKVEPEDQDVELVSDHAEIDAAPAAEADEAVTEPEEVVLESAVETIPENGDNEEQLDIKEDDGTIEVLEAVEIVLDQNEEESREIGENEEGENLDAVPEPSVEIVDGAEANGEESIESQVMAALEQVEMLTENAVLNENAEDAIIADDSLENLMEKLSLENDELPEAEASIVESETTPEDDGTEAQETEVSLVELVNAEAIDETEDAEEDNVEASNQEEMAEASAIDEIRAQSSVEHDDVGSVVEVEQACDQDPGRENQEMVASELPVEVATLDAAADEAIEEAEALELVSDQITATSNENCQNEEPLEGENRDVEAPVEIVDNAEAKEEELVESESRAPVDEDEIVAENEGFNENEGDAIIVDVESLENRANAETINETEDAEEQQEPEEPEVSAVESAAEEADQPLDQEAGNENSELAGAMAEEEVEAAVAELESEAVQEAEPIGEATESTTEGDDTRSVVEISTGCETEDVVQAIHDSELEVKVEEQDGLLSEDRDAASAETGDAANGTIEVSVAENHANDDDTVLAASEDAESTSANDGECQLAPAVIIVEPVEEESNVAKEAIEGGGGDDDDNQLQEDLLSQGETSAVVDQAFDEIFDGDGQPGNVDDEEEIWHKLQKDILEEQQQTDAAVRIQSSFRGYQARKLSRPLSDSSAGVDVGAEDGGASAVQRTDSDAAGEEAVELDSHAPSLTEALATLTETVTKVVLFLASPIEIPFKKNQMSLI